MNAYTETGDELHRVSMPTSRLADWLAGWLAGWLQRREGQNTYEGLGIRVVALALAEVHAVAGLQRRLQELLVEVLVGGAAGKADEVAVFAAAVPELVRPHALRTEELEVLLGDGPELRRRHLHAHNLRVAQLPVILHAHHVVVADLVVFRQPPGIACVGRQLVVAAADDLLLRRHELVLHMPEAPAPEVHVHELLAPAVGRARRLAAAAEEQGRRRRRRSRRRRAQEPSAGGH